MIAGSEPNRLPPMISATIIRLQMAITAQVFRSFCSWPAPSVPGCYSVLTSTAMNLSLNREVE